MTIQVQTATSHQPFHPGLCVSLSRGRLSPVINHSTLAYVGHYPGADCHQSSTIPPWSMCVTIQGQTAPSHQPFHPGLCVSLSRCRLPPVINHSTLAYVCHYPGADCHQSSTIPPWPMCVTIQGQTATSHQPFHPFLQHLLHQGVAQLQHLIHQGAAQLQHLLHQGAAQLAQEDFPQTLHGKADPIPLTLTRNSEILSYQLKIYLVFFLCSPNYIHGP